MLTAWTPAGCSAFRDGGRVPDTEMSEFLYPMLMLWRREEPDSGGPGRYRGGVSASLAMTPWGTGTPMGLVLASAYKAVAQNNEAWPQRLPGQHRAGNDRPRVHRTSPSARWAAGNIPGQPERGRGGAGGRGRTTLRPTWRRATCSICMHWQGGRPGYGDPLRQRAGRGRGRPARRQDRPRAARETSTVSSRMAPGGVDLPATQAARSALLADAAATGSQRRGVRSRPARSTRRPASGWTRILSWPTTAAIRSTAALTAGSDWAIRALGPALALARYDGPAEQASREWSPRAPRITSTDAVVFRQYCCPGCWTAIYSSIDARRSRRSLYPRWSGCCRNARRGTR